jgi:hypothetical protein
MVFLSLEGHYHYDETFLFHVSNVAYIDLATV